MAEHNFKDQYEYWDQEADKLLGVANGMNYQDFQNGSEYQDLNTRYTDRGNKAMENTLAQVAARTGGLASSYATMAANNSYNDYMSQLEDAARNLYSQRLNESQQAYQLARNNADDYYSRWMQEQQLAASKAARYSGGSSSPNYSNDDLYNLLNVAAYKPTTTGNVDRNTTIGEQNISANTTGYSSWIREAQNILNTKNYAAAVNYIQNLPATSDLKEEIYNALKSYYQNATGKTKESEGDNWVEILRTRSAADPMKNGNGGR